MTAQLLDDFDLYSDLILSTGTSVADRPLTPIEVSDMILRLEKETGETRQQIARRLGLGRKTKVSSMNRPPDTTQLNHFLKLQNLSRKNAYMLGFRDTPGKIPFTLGAVVADLPNKDDHNTVLKTVLASYDTKMRITKEDVREIVYRKKASPKEPISEIIETVVKSKPVVDHYYMIGVSLPASIGMDRGDPALLRESVNAVLAGIEIATATIRDNTFFVSMDEENFSRMETQRKKTGMTITKFFRRVLEKAHGI